MTDKKPDTYISYSRKQSVVVEEKPLPPQSEVFRTPDLYLAAYLQACGSLMTETEREGTRVYFIFKRDQALEERRGMWVSQTGEVNAARYAYSIKGLKAECHRE